MLGKLKNILESNPGMFMMKVINCKSLNEFCPLSLFKRMIAYRWGVSVKYALASM